MSDKERIQEKLEQLTQRYPHADSIIRIAVNARMAKDPVSLFRVFGYELELSEESMEESLFNMELAYAWLEHKFNLLHAPQDESSRED